MTVIIKDQNFVKGGEAEIYKILIALAPKLVQLGRNKLEEAYTSTFERNPIDTGESKSNTFVSQSAQLRPYPTISIAFESKNMFPFIYFAEPLQEINPNFKYGKRNTIISARDKLAEQLGIN